MIDRERIIRDARHNTLGNGIQISIGIAFCILLYLAIIYFSIGIWLGILTVTGLFVLPFVYSGIRMLLLKRGLACGSVVKEK